MDAAGWFRGRIDPTRAVGAIALGDLTAITLFVVVGQYQHGADPLARPLGALEAALPFYLAWILVGLAAGLFTAEAVVSARRALAWSLPAWIIAVIVALPIRVVAVSGGASLVFAVVTVVVGGVLVVGWRTAVPVLGRSLQ